MDDNAGIYCDAYGIDVNPAECEHCIIKNDCKKIKLINNQEYL